MVGTMACQKEKSGFNFLLGFEALFMTSVPSEPVANLAILSTLTIRCRSSRPIYPVRLTSPSFARQRRF